MDSKIERFFRGMRAKRVALLGIGVSNTGLVPLFVRCGAQVTACDKRTRAQLGEKLAARLEAQGAALRLGEDYLDGLQADVVVRTPGMYFLSPALTALRDRGVVVTSEMELFFDLCPCKILAVTGSDGKTTTSTLVAEMLREAGHTVHLGGNIGRALLPDIELIRPEDVAVVELSSFQLLSMRASPAVAVVTNIAPNHLDVHRDMEEYVGAKQHIFLHQNAFSCTVLNADDSASAAFAPAVRGRLRQFSLQKPVADGAFLREDGVLCTAAHAAVTPLLPAAQLRLPGRHNVANCLAAAAAVEGMAPPEAICKVAREFGGVEHRMELVRERNGVRWYNDSIATSPSRAVAGLAAFEQKLVLIAGGYDKNIPFEPLAPHLVRKVRLLILTGATAPKIEAAVTADPGYRPGYPEILHADDLAQAVALARSRAVPGDIVSLSPACASFDRYPNFEARGRHFKEIVRAME